MTKPNNTAKLTLVPDSPLLSAQESANINIKAFEDWVCTDVLPSIRKTGTYNVPEGMTIPEPHVLKGAFRDIATSMLED
ncbi:hypothetical protein [Paremcibacter congregatus]|uniref:Uncharacterized protein n=1 Tax=Paremcibacter congregatus TaxID=2043170 RepID=A0A2G4YUC1_9PROT|nr:hypothetical protein [Paremcibacter congregatus]PHZ85929.1 hypothetical protein CRD36_04440 [Paremcibacter congregatus]QDE26894.1 hypothetical protein FIV45_06210 [Paremcibacter congregatus]